MSAQLAQGVMRAGPRVLHTQRQCFPALLELLQKQDRPQMSQQQQRQVSSSSSRTSL